MKLTVRETKKAIKNNQTVKFTLERNNARELTSNKKYYKRYVKAIVKTVKSFYPALDSSYILSELERYEILPNISRFDEEGYLIRYGKQRYVTAQTFEVSDDKIYWVKFDYNDDYFIVDEYLGMKLDSDVAVSDPFTNHFAILANDPNVLFHVTDEELLPLFLKLSMKSNEHITNNNIIYKIGIAFDGFRIIEGFRNRNKLFLSDRIYHEIYKLENDNYRNRNPLVLFFEEKNGTKAIGAKITHIEVLDEKGEEIPKLSWVKRIKEIYLNKDKSSLVILIDESFQWADEKKENLEKENQKKKKKTLESKVDLLLK